MQAVWRKRIPFYIVGASVVAQKVKNLPAMQETWDQSLDREDPLKKGMATTPVFLPGEFHGQRSLVGYSPCGCKELDTTEQLTHKSTLLVGVNWNTHYGEQYGGSLRN